MKSLQTKYNSSAKHCLEWKRCIGKVVGAPDEGLLHCTVCGKNWKWKDRLNLKRTKCIPPEPSSSSTTRKSQSDLHTVVPTNRLRQKTTENEIRRCQASSSTGRNPDPGPLSNEQSLLRVPGHADSSREWRAGVG